MSSQGLQQVQKQAQTLVLAPQLRQSLKVLQVPALELRSTILEELEQNPSLEELPMEGVSLDHEAEAAADKEYDDSPLGAEDGELRLGNEDFSTLNRLHEDYRDYYAQEASAQGAYTAEAAQRRQHLFDSLTSETSLQEYLLGQIRMLTLSDAERAALDYLIGSLDERGFLTANASDVALATRLPLATVQSAIATLQKLDPAGIGAAGLRDSLLLQLKLKGMEKSLPATLLLDHYELLLRRRIPEIARRCGIDTSQVQSAIETIATLDPAPASRFAADNNSIIVPDIRIYKEDDVWHVSLNNDYIPRLRINPVYRAMIAQGRINDSDKEYIREKIRSGRFLINAIEQRQQTIERIARQLLDLQRDFFEEGVRRLRPLTMSQMAQLVGVHETTVSRAIANKYIETPHGVFEMKYFFTPGYEGKDGEALSNTSVKDKIAQIVAAENPSKPHSDQSIVQLLAQDGVKIARRTVAKYREQMDILPTNLRRRYQKQRPPAESNTQ